MPIAIPNITCAKLFLRRILVLFSIFVAIVGANGQAAWTTANPGNWSNPSTWTANAVPPTAVSMGTVTLSHSVTLDQNAIAGTLNITAGTLTVSGSNTLSVTGSATIASGAVFTNSSSNAANITINNFVVSNGGTYNHDAVGSSSNGASTDFPGTTRSFGASSNVVITKWASGGSATVALPVIASPGWGNLTINVASLGGTYWQQNGGLTRVQGDFTLKNTANKELTLFNSQSGGTTFSKNVYIEGGVLCVLQNGNGNGINININGNLTLSGTGKLTLTAGSFSFFSTSEPRVFLKGDLSISNSAQILQPNTLGVVAIFVFKKTTGIQYFTCNNATGVSEGYIGWGIGDETSGGGCTNTLYLNSNFIAKNVCVFRVYKNATLECPAEIYIKGAGSTLVSPSGFTLYAGSNIKIGSINGITAAGVYLGNIQSAGSRNYNTNANYIYTGAYNQVTGNGLPPTITGSLSIANTGIAGDNTVTLTTNNTTTSKLNLNSGYFAAGTNRNLNISTGGTINGNGGNNPDLPSAGTITFLGSGFTSGSASGNPALYSVLINGAVDFNGNPNTNSATILNRLQLNFGSSVVNAPVYKTTSTLVYNTTGSYNRNNEWGQVTAGLQGYPYNVAVQNGTSLNLANNPPISLEIGGNLDIGSEVMGVGTGTGQVLMNASTFPLRVLGNLTIGSNSTTLSKLKLSTEPTGGLVLSGNFTRYNAQNYFDNNVGDIPTTSAKVPVVELNGNANTFINVYATPNAQNFYNLRMNKTGTGDMTLNCTSLIENKLDLTHGKINTGTTNLMTLETLATVTGSPGLNSFINGPLAKKTSAANTPVGTYEFFFPIGKAAPTIQYKPCYMLPVTASGTTTYTGEFFPGNPASIYPVPFIGNLSYLNKNYYWTVDRAGSGTARLALDYAPGNLPSDWVAAGGSPSPASIPANTNVAIVKDFGTYWNFTETAGNLNDQGPMYEARNYTTTGKIYTDTLSSFSPFSFGLEYNTILPVNLLSFTVRLVIGDGKLEWKVADSKDLDGFELEYSTDGRRYTNLATVASNGSVSYSYRHANLPAGTNCYRLFVKDKNGKAFYSQVVLLTVGSMKTRIIGLTNNPVADRVTPMLLSAGDQKVEAIIRDGVGKLLYRQLGQLKTGQNQWPLPAVDLPSKGMYFITIITADGESATLKFFKE